MRVKKRKNMHLFKTSMMQRGGFPVFRGRRTFRGGGLGSIFKGAFRVIGKPLLKMGRGVLKSIGPQIARDVAATGAELVSGKTSLKKALKKTAKQTGKTVARGTRAALERELATYQGKQSGGQLMMMKRGKSKLRKRN